LAHASYVGLVHAGEPMLAPMFEPLLEIVPRSAVVHLLTNGMALTEAKLARILDLGVRSLSFSLDGMTASTNDVLRIGSRVDLLIDRIATSTKLAHDRGVRVGISWVVTRANAGELPSLVHFAKSAQLDWIKLEEMFGHDDLALDRYSLDVAVANARELAGELAGDLALLDHTRAMTVWRCQLDVDARMKKRATLDDFVNRVEINPCRAPWETICIEPNGDVRPLSFHHPIAGSLVDTPL